MSQDTENKLETTKLQPQGSRPNFLVMGFGAVGLLILMLVGIFLLTSADGKETPASASLDAVATAGKALFQNNNCSNCHSADGRAGGIGPRLSTINLSDDSIRTTVRRGKGMMPANGRLTDPEIDKIIAYIRAIKATVPQ